MKHILLLGATGTAGSAITEKLLSDTDYHVTLFARHARDKFSDSPRTAVVNGDAENMEDLKKAIKGRTLYIAPYREKPCRKLQKTLLRLWASAA